MSGIVMLTSAGRSSTILFNALNREFGVDRIVVEQSIPRGQMLKGRVKRWGARKVVGQVLFRTLVVPPLKARSGKRIRAILDQHGLDDTPIPAGKRIDVESVNSERVKALLAELKPSVVVINGTRIIKEEVLRSVDARFINIHVGITPTYRGVHGGYWALVEKEPEACGVTVYFVDAGIDTGQVIGQALISPTAEDNFVTYPFLQLAAGIPLAKKAVREVLAGNVETMPHPQRPSKLWTHPTLGEYVTNLVLRGVK